MEPLNCTQQRLKMNIGIELLDNYLLNSIFVYSRAK